jgi:AraC-like DNA-binding protein
LDGGGTKGGQVSGNRLGRRNIPLSPEVEAILREVEAPTPGLVIEAGPGPGEELEGRLLAMPDFAWESGKPRTVYKLTRAGVNVAKSLTASDGQKTTSNLAPTRSPDAEQELERPPSSGTGAEEGDNPLPPEVEAVLRGVETPTVGLVIEAGPGPGEELERRRLATPDFAWKGERPRIVYKLTRAGLDVARSLRASESEKRTRHLAPTRSPDAEEELERLHAAYWDGAPLEMLAQAAGVGPQDLAEGFRAAGMPIFRPRSATERGWKPPYDQASGRSKEADGRVPQRVLEMHGMREAGATLAEVGRRFGLSRARIHQIFKQYALPRPDPARRSQSRLEENRPAIREAFECLGQVPAVADELGLPRQLVSQAVREDPAWARRHRKDRKGGKKKYSDGELMACVKEAASKWEGPLTGAKYESYARGRTLADGRPWPGRQTFALRYSTWREALGRAGVVANPSSGVAGHRKFDRGRCVGAVRYVANQLGKTPTVQEYERLAQQSAGSLPSVATVRHRLGTWDEALREAEL